MNVYTHRIDNVVGSMAHIGKAELLQKLGDLFRWGIICELHRPCPEFVKIDAWFGIIKSRGCGCPRGALTTSGSTGGGASGGTCGGRGTSGGAS